MLDSTSAPEPLVLFVSYHRADEETYGTVAYLKKHVANRFQSQTGHALRLFIDTEEPGGAEWKKKIPEVARRCDFFLPLLSVSYFNSPHCRNEARWFLDSRTSDKHKTSIVPIALFNPALIHQYCPPTARTLLEQLDSFNWIQAGDAIDTGFTGPEAQALLRRLVSETLIPFWNKKKETQEQDMTSDGGPAPDAEFITGEDAALHAGYGDGAFVGATPPESYAIKGNERSKKYHLPGTGSYERTSVEVWFNSEEAAAEAGFTKAPQTRNQSGTTTARTVPWSGSANVHKPASATTDAQINTIANPHLPEKGERYLGTVVKLTPFGAFVSFIPGKDGLLHISKLRALTGGKRVEDPEDVLSVGQKLQVEISEIDDRGKLSLVPVVEEAAAE